MSFHVDTSLSLLERVRKGEAAAWSQFSAEIGALLGQWCQRWGVQASDADDVIQDTLLIVLGQIAVFRRRGTGSFRLWIRTIAWRCWCDAISRAERSIAPEVLENFQHLQQDRQSLEVELDLLLERQIFDQAIATVSQRVSVSTWEAFRLTAIDGLPGEKAATMTGLKLNAVYAARYRVQRLITEEIRHLRDQDFVS